MSFNNNVINIIIRSLVTFTPRSRPVLSKLINEAHEIPFVSKHAIIRPTSQPGPTSKRQTRRQPTTSRSGTQVCHEFPLQLRKYSQLWIFSGIHLLHSSNKAARLVLRWQYCIREIAVGLQCWRYCSCFSTLPSRRHHRNKVLSSWRYCNFISMVRSC